MANEERLLGQDLNGVCSIGGLVGFLESIKKSGGNTEQKKIGINAKGFVMNQPGEKNPIEHEAVLMVPQIDADDFMKKYQPGTILDSFYTPLTDLELMTDAGDTEIESCDWDAAVLENNVVKTTIKLRTLGYGDTTEYTAPGAGGGGGG